MAFWKSKAKKREEKGYEELLELWLDFMEAFKKVLEKGTDEEKMRAVGGFNRVQDLLRTKIAEFSDKQDVDLKQLEKLLEQDVSEEVQKFKEAKKQIKDIQKSIEPLLEKRLPKKKRSRLARKRKMERDILSRE